MQIERQDRVYSLADAEELMVKIEQIAGAKSGCLVATAMLTERGGPSPCVIPAGIFGGDTRSLDDMDRAVLIAQLWVVVQRLERDLGQESQAGLTEFRELVSEVRGSLLASPTFAPIREMAASLAEDPEYTLLGSVVSLAPVANRFESQGGEETTGVPQ